LRSSVAIRRRTNPPTPQPVAQARRIPFWNIPAWLATTLPLGLLDGAVGFAYLLHIGIVRWHAAVLAAKLVLMLLRMRYIRTIPKVGMYMLMSILFLIATSLISGINGLSPLVAALGFTAEFVVTLAIIDATPPVPGAKKADYTLYAAGVACAIGLTASIHFIMAHMGRIPALWGRYLYFNWTQPNEGGEMAAAGAIAAMLGLPRWRAIALTMVLIADTSLLQSRAGLITEALCIIVRLCFDAERKLYRSSAILIGISMILLAIKGALFGMDDPILSHVSSALMMDDHYRGMGSGFSGRSGLWDVAIQLFGESPIIGHGLGFYDSIGYIGPHNILLYGLGEYGLTAMPFLGCIVYAFYQKAKSSIFIFMIMLSSVPLLLFNDRFMDLNPYPFVIYIFLAAASADPARRAIVQVSPRGGRGVGRQAIGRQPRQVPVR
jgi:O-antigen ligase